MAVYKVRVFVDKRFFCRRFAIWTVVMVAVARAAIINLFVYFLHIKRIILFFAEIINL